MANKFKVGDLVECNFYDGYKRMKIKLGIVLKVGIDYPDAGARRSRFALIQWNDGGKYPMWKAHGNGYTSTKVVVRSEK